jgi:diguanylate cyclase (GGDEF)-like protein/PAS domain S-box-containing protein
MDIAAALIYWVAVLLWLGVLATVARSYFKNRRTFSTVHLLLLVVACDTIRNIVENVYFGTYFGALYGLFPNRIADVLGQSNFLIIPKIINVVAACFVLGLLLLRWLPAASRERQSAEDAVIRQTAASELEAEENRCLFEASPDLIVVTDSERVIRRISESCKAILGFEPDEIEGQYGGDFLQDGELLRIREIIQRSAETGRAQNFQATFVHKNGRGVSLNFNGVWSRQAQRFFLIGRDMTDMLAAEAKLRRLALFDQLTGLPNRTTLMLDLEQLMEVASTAEFTVAIFDLDGFKDINDALGHPAGDEVLQLVARRAAEAAPGGSVYRLGGDEFVVVFPNDANPVSASDQIHALMTKCEEGIEVAGRQVFVGVSVGICSSTQAEHIVDELIYCADLALYHAKANGGRKLRLFEPSMRSVARARQELEKEIRLAVLNREFELYYQPQVRLSDEAVVGAEALLRWNHPTKGLLVPGTFIEVLRQSSSAPAVGQWILESACREAAEWPSHGLDSLRIGVNLFPCQYWDQLVVDVKSALRASGLKPECLELEITEDVALERQEKAPAMMRELRSIGVGLAFDDFGTGYASLSYLTRYPLTRLKIDRSFVHGLLEEGSGNQKPIVRSIIAMAHNLGLQVVAEGIETPQQAALLRAKNCDEVQGYLYGRPMRAAEFIRHVQGRTGQPDRLAGLIRQPMRKKG